MYADAPLGSVCSCPSSRQTSPSLRLCNSLAESHSINDGVMIIYLIIRFIILFEQEMKIFNVLSIRYINVNVVKLVLIYIK